MPSSASHLEKILRVGNGMHDFDPPIPIISNRVSNASDDGENDGREDVRASDERRGRNGGR
jgi:hypothetical protein